jgi:hypothetical protein
MKAAGKGRQRMVEGVRAADGRSHWRGRLMLGLTDGQRRTVRFLAALFAIHETQHHMRQIRNEQRMRQPLMDQRTGDIRPERCIVAQQVANHLPVSLVWVFNKHALYDLQCRLACIVEQCEIGRRQPSRIRQR